jgi:two-component system, NtrC family, response regulator AtoC
MTRPVVPTSDTQTIGPDELPGTAPATSASILVIHGLSSRRYALPRDGVMVIGRAPESDIRIDVAAISRRHAKIIVTGGEAHIADLGSHNGTLLNGERVEGSRALASGDAVTMGEALLVLRGEARPVGRAVLDLGRLRARLEEEIERARDYVRPLAVAAFCLGGARASAVAAEAAAALRLMDVLGGDTASQLIAVLPELGGEAARAAARELLLALAPHAPEVRCGLAAYPDDGGDADTLLAGARAAAAIAAPEAITLAAETAVRHSIGESRVVVADPVMLRMFDLIRRLAGSELPVLILGETGAGKENAAAALHHWSARASGPLVTLNCAALPESLVESELFGHQKGAFSDARADKPGLLERASFGTVFLDEIGELPLGAQAKLLRALEARRITRLGDVREREIDIRVVAATNRDLEAECRAGRFRQDLLFRLSAAVVELPPLRHRPREVPILARLFLAEAAARGPRPELPLSDGALAALCAYAFPGNVRELKNAMDYALATAEGPAIEAWNLPARISGRSTSLPPTAGEDLPTPIEATAEGSLAPLRRLFRPLAEEVRELECARMQEALEAAGFVQRRAAELIGMPIRTFSFKLKQYGIATRESKGGA